ncbi:MAG: YraN family protein [Pirellulaceae bacterium]|nr:YraN family protein [Pirellulaceae bacterium]
MFVGIQRLGRWIRSSGLLFWCSPNSDPNVLAGQKDLGTAGEQVAADYLKGIGYRIVARGHRQKLGEIDIIAVDGQYIVFVEVKTWRSDRDGDPSQAVTQSKQDKITRTALTYLKRHKLLNQPARFDVISIVWQGGSAGQPKLKHYKHAFQASGRGPLWT